jgi:micrococcal nuclease
MIQGTHIEVEMVRVIDGDTISVRLPGSEKAESLRLLCLDTEESFAFGSKPVTPWGKQAKKRAQAFFADAQTITIEFPSNDPLETCMSKHRGNFSRLLVYAHHQQQDFQEVMIREGYSPYFMKYGHAAFASKHAAYQTAERQAQSQHIGVWNQIEVNGSEQRNYATLSVWWKLRAALIDDYRQHRTQYPELLNSRLDYDQIAAKALRKQSITIFTELAYVRRAGGIHGLASYGSDERPLNIFIPRLFSDDGEALLNLLNQRYIRRNETHPAASYAYISGVMSLYNGIPQLTLSSIDQVCDTPSQLLQRPVLIKKALIDPEGRDAGNETITLYNPNNSSISLTDWQLRDKALDTITLNGDIEAQSERTITLPGYQLRLNNNGDQLQLIDHRGAIQHEVHYEKGDVVRDEDIEFS